MITSRLDWYTVILENTSFQKVLEKLNYPVADYDSLKLRQFTDNRVDVQFVYTLDSNINFKVPYDELLQYQRQIVDPKTGEALEDFNVFTQNFSKVRVDFPGSALDFLRKLDIPFDPDYDFQNRLFWSDICSDFHLTRVDFAFDFFNEDESFLRELVRILNDQIYQANKNSSSFGYKLKNSFSTRPLKCSIKNSSSERTVYLGSTNGDKLLRIYDKFLEAHKNGIWIASKIPWWVQESLPPEKISSWCRFELQTRRELCEVFLYDDLKCFAFDQYAPFEYRSAECLNFRRVLAHVFQYYLCYSDSDELNSLVRDFFDVSKLDRIELAKPIAQNRNLVQLGREATEVQIKRECFRLIRWHMTYRLGDELIDFINDYITHHLERSISGNVSSEGWINRFFALINQLVLSYGKELVEDRFVLCTPLEYCSCYENCYLIKK